LSPILTFLFFIGTVGNVFGTSKKVSSKIAPTFLQETIHEIKKNTANSDSTEIYMAEAISFANDLNIDKANQAIKKYIKASGDINFIDQHEFIVLRDSLEYQKLVDTYKPKLNGWAVFFYFSAVIGIFISLILNFKKSHDRIPNLLIALFVFFHSVLIADLGLFSSNFRFQLPDSLFVSTTFSFLYGPLLYFYFKKTTRNYRFKPLDALHLIPSLILLVYIFPYYLLSPEEKLHLMLNMEKYLIPGGRFIFLSKATSLCIYAFLVFKLFKKQSLFTEKRIDLNRWQQQISSFFIAYTLSYVIYGLSIIRVIELPFMIYLQGGILSSLVLYIAYMAFTRPVLFMSLSNNLDSVIEGRTQIKSKLYKGDLRPEKYLKSGLTSDYSLELKEDLLNLLGNRKIFKINNLTLERLSVELETNRHNTSQVINEHFNVNFFELINQYRINEAKSILENDIRKNMNIIDVAYEVGYNNKVTFNKSFKKATNLTPSQYRNNHKKKLRVNTNQTLDKFNFSSEHTNLFSGSGAA
jgi:AraC-like DNA-binding protein